MILFLAACSDKKNTTDWTKQLRIKEKQPYDLFLSYQHLKDIFPKAKISEKYKIFDNHMSYVFIPNSDSAELKIITGNAIEFSSDEMIALRRFVQDGNSVLIAASEIDQGFYEALDIRTVDRIQVPKFNPSNAEISDIAGVSDYIFEIYLMRLRSKIVLYIRGLPLTAFLLTQLLK
jgi:hypothetical protein